MKELWLSRGYVIMALAGMAAWSGLAAQGQAANSASPAPVAEVRSDAGKPTEPSGQEQDSTALSPATQEILKLLRSGVSTEVIKTYVEHSPSSRPLSAADVIALKEKAVPDELIATLIRRNAEPATLARSAGANPSMREIYLGANGASGPAYGTGNIQPGRLDPEGYDFWWYHYAYPRALAYANQRVLSSYNSPYNSSYNSLYGPAFYGYGYYPYPPLPFWPAPYGTFTPFTQPRQMPGQGNFPR